MAGRYRRDAAGADEPTGGEDREGDEEEAGVVLPPPDPKLNNPIRQLTPIIVGVERGESRAGFAADAGALELDHVDGRMSDGRIERIFVARRGAIAIADEELIGLTAEEARRLAESRGEVR